VVFTWQYCSDAAASCVTLANFQPIEKVEAVDKTTAKITWKQPNPNFYISFVGFSGYIVQKKQFQDCMGAKAAECPANNAPIGTGPYKLKDFKPGDTVTYEKNPMYRDAAKLGFDTVEIKGGGDAVSAAQAVFVTGDTDFAWNLQVQKAVLEQIMGQGDKATLDAPPGPNVERIEINFANPDPALGDKRSEPDQPHPFLADIKVRQALSLAIDRKAIADELYGPLGDPTCNILTAPPDFVSPNTKCDQDVEKAKQLLDEAGWKMNDATGVREKDGKPMVLSYQTSINALRQNEQALVKQYWAAIGVTSNLRAIDGGVFFGSDAGNPDNFGHFFADVEMYTSSPDSPDPTTYFDGWTCAQMAQKSNGWNLNNNNRYCNKDYDAMVTQLHSETDPAKRKDLFIKLNDKIVNDVVNIPLVARKTTPNGYSKALQGPKNNPWDSSLWNIAEWHK
jgi:peptide/nickel transport system substrate-binding protein